MGDATITFGELGINEITHPVKLTNDKGTTSIQTDWNSPYIAGAIIDGVESGNHAAVSGNHGTSGGGGFATANTRSTEVKVDDRLISNSYSGLVKKIEVTIVNEVTLKENINLINGVRNSVDFIETTVYVIEHNHMRIKDVSLEALTPMYITTYMGPQFTREYNDKMYFTYDEVQSLVYTNTGTRINSGTKSESPNMTRATMMNDNNELLHVYVDKDYGIGYDHIGDNGVPAYMRENYGKFYYHLIKTGQTLTFNAGDVHSYRGGYIFAEDTGTNAYVSRFVENGVKKAFVDFRSVATEQIEYTSIEDSVGVIGNGTSLTASIDNAYAKVVI